MIERLEPFFEDIESRLDSDDEEEIITGWEGLG